MDLIPEPPGKALVFLMAFPVPFGREKGAQRGVKRSSEVVRIALGIHTFFKVRSRRRFGSKMIDLGPCSWFRRAVLLVPLAFFFALGGLSGTLEGARA